MCILDTYIVFPFLQVVDESESLSHQLLLSQWEEEEEERRHTFTIASRDQQQHKKVKQRTEVQIYWSKQTQHVTTNGGQVKPATVFLMLCWCCTIETNMPLQMEASCSVCCSRLELHCRNQHATTNVSQVKPGAVFLVLRCPWR